MKEYHVPKNFPEKFWETWYVYIFSRNLEFRKNNIFSFIYHSVKENIVLNKTLRYICNKIEPQKFIFLLFFIIYL